MNLKTIKTIKGYDVTILSMNLEENKWYCGYVKLKNNIQEDEYCNETYRDNNIIGVDTNHYYNQKQSNELKLKDCIRQITKIIEEHLLFTNMSNKTRKWIRRIKK